MLVLQIEFSSRVWHYILGATESKIVLNVIVLTDIDWYMFRLSFCEVSFKR